MDFLQARELAEIRHHELLAHAARRRLESRGSGPHRGSGRWRQALRDVVMALRTHSSAMLRSGSPQPADMPPDAEPAKLEDWSNVMNQLQMMVAGIEACDLGGPRDAEGRRRQYTFEELDALADSGWSLPDVRGFVTACLTAARGRWRLASRLRGARATLAPVEGR